MAKSKTESSSKTLWQHDFQLLNRNGRTKTDIMSPWELELEDQEKYSTWRSILGSIQLSGAAYLGYEYLKKHGLR